MAELNIITSQGYILKKEKLALFAWEKNYSDMILEDLDPFPGFYDHFFIPANDSENKPRSIFIVLKESNMVSEDRVIRVTMGVKEKLDIKFDAALASIELFNKPAQCIRVFMEDYEQLHSLISNYKSEGINFQSKKEVKPYQSLIEVRKYFEMKELSEGIYKDLEQSDTYYLKIPGFVPWDKFEHQTIIIRNNMNHKLYDAAQAAIYDKSGLVDLVRIFDRSGDIEILNLLRLKYLNEFERM